MGQGSEMQSDPTGKFAGERSGEGLGGAVLVGVEVLEEFECLLTEEPIAETAIAPGSEVDGVDGFGVEFSLEDGLNFGKVVEPRENGESAMAVKEAFIDLLADVVGKVGSLSGASVHRGRSWIGLVSGRERFVGRTSLCFMPQ